MPKVETIKHPADKIGWGLKKSAWSAVAESILIMIFGILLVVWPDITVVVIANILGAIFIVSGIYQIINYFVVKGQNDFFNNSLLSGVVALLVGIAAIVIGEDIANIFRIIIGVWMIYESLVRVNTAIKLHATGVKVWSYILIIAIMMLALGIFVTFNSGAIMQLIGWMMVLTGIIGVVGDAMFIQQINTVAEKLTK
ncbi:DUF308 domain-containing protein [Candidatus Saccharibacteria bacterium]|nr:DUF308 domain-containing protein [Candidatus Saccharibacteria bacterium]